MPGGEDAEKTRTIEKRCEEVNADLFKDMIAMVPDMVDNHIMKLLEPIKSDLEDIRTRQIV